MPQKWYVWEKALNKFQEAPASTSKTSCPCDNRMFGHFRAYGSELLPQALGHIYEGVRWPTLPDKVTLGRSVSILMTDGAHQSILHQGK